MELVLKMGIILMGKWITLFFNISKMQIKGSQRWLPLKNAIRSSGVRSPKDPTGVVGNGVTLLYLFIYLYYK